MAANKAGVEPSPENLDRWCDDQIAGFSAKADHNKCEAQFFFVLVIAATLLTPLFVTLGVGPFWSKMVPSALSTAAAAATAWLQLRRPQQLWAMYRSAQRELEDYRTRYRFQLPPYTSDDGAMPLSKQHAENIAQVAMKAHNQWLGVVPKLEHLQALETPKRETASDNE